MNRTDYEAVVHACELQEELIRVDHLSNDDMLELGNFIVTEAKNQGVSVAVSLIKPSGAVVFQHLMDGMSAGHQNWMRRKFNVCAQLERCTLRAWAKEVLTGETLADYGMNTQDHVFCGGAFPIKCKTGEFAAVLSISGFAHFTDHQFGVNCLAKWLGIPNVPEVPFFDVWRE